MNTEDDEFARIAREQALNKMADNARELGLDYEPAQQEPVAAECNFVGTKEWGRCSIEHHNLVQSEPHKWPGYQTRLLYTSHQLARQQEPVRIYDYVWPQREEHKDECIYACSYTPSQHLERGELLAVVHPSQLISTYLQREGETAENPLYTSPPPQRTWVGLTDGEITDIWAESSPYYHEDDFARAIEAKLKEKNT